MTEILLNETYINYESTAHNYMQYLKLLPKVYWTLTDGNNAVQHSISSELGKSN